MKRSLTWLLSAGLVATFSANLQAKQVEVHDPVMAKEGNTYYAFST